MSGTHWERQVAETAQRYQDMRNRVAQLSVTEVSRDGMVQVTVSASGHLTDLTLKERWRPTPATRIAVEIMQCVRRAQARIPDLLQQAMIETVGPRDPAAHLIVAEARERFPQPPELEPTPPAPRTGIAGGEDDWDGRPVMEDIQ
ncbi:YbaB/EbfC family nucleoid-associated protein [Actinocrispum wychmicini]|uniref:YbaB/EbfC DNA-binding family protein n=1 Tax=Actinocrispum wychmicini TaxID=1213861 RepID=A0A4R2J9B4_9PSEU|nr:YbaB/EbfC family nucleoid-associated protein [Actinocrispum wychmicini]TCO52479.1 YbaB/EbfC DNA-binding family protein [Actinocrispum wychmicini]